MRQINRDPKKIEIYRQREDSISDKNNALLSAEKKRFKANKLKIAKTAKSTDHEKETLSNYPDTFIIPSRSSSWSKRLNVSTA